jgi:hypothetical protein
MWLAWKQIPGCFVQVVRSALKSDIPLLHSSGDRPRT